MGNVNEIETKSLLKSLVGLGMFSKIFKKKDKTKQDQRDKKELDRLSKKASKYEKRYLDRMNKKVRGMSVRDYMKKQGYLK